MKPRIRIYYRSYGESAGLNWMAYYRVLSDTFPRLMGMLHPDGEWVPSEFLGPGY